MGNCCDTRVLPVHTTAIPSSSVEEKHPKSSSKVESGKGRNVFKVLRNIHHMKDVVPWDAEEPEAQASTSREKQQSQIKVLSKRADSASSEEGEEKSPLRRVKVASKKSRHGSNILKTLSRKGTLPLTDVEGHNFIDETCTEKPHKESEVNREEVPPVPECPDSATLPVDKEKAPVKTVTSRKRRLILAILRKFSRKRSVAPLEVEKPQVLPGTSKETAHVTTEAVPENADAAPSAGGQGETPVGMEKVATKKRRHIFSFLRRICQNSTVASQDIERPSVSEDPSAKTTEMKTEDIPDNTDNTLAPDGNKNTSETVESEEGRKRRRISELLKRIDQKQATGPQYGIGTQAFSGASPETTVKKETENSASPSVAEEKTSESMTKVEPRRLKCFESLLQRFFKKDPGPSEAPEEPPVLESTFKEIPQTRKRGTENVPDIKQIFCREEEFEPHDEGSWEEYKSYFPGGVHVPESRHTTTSTIVGSCTAQAGDTDVEKQQQDLDSKESFPDVIEVQQWEQRKVSSTVLAPAANTLFLAPPTSSDDGGHISMRRTKKKKWRRRYY